jgi:hypothetical protein
MERNKRRDGKEIREIESNRRGDGKKRNRGDENQKALFVVKLKLI